MSTTESLVSIPIPDITGISTLKNLKWLFVLRNLMILVEALTVFISVYGLDIPLHQAALTGVITSQVILNWFTWLRLDFDRPVSDIELFGQLSFDVLTITAVLYFTGGATNPMTWFYLLPLIISATILSAAFTWYMVVFTSACYTLLMVSIGLCRRSCQ